jgi:hypothetical protein
MGKSQSYADCNRICHLTGDSDSTTRKSSNTSKATGDTKFNLWNAELDESDGQILRPAESDLVAQSVSGLYTDERTSRSHT